MRQTERKKKENKVQKKVGGKKDKEIKMSEWRKSAVCVVFFPLVCLRRTAGRVCV